MVITENRCELDDNVILDLHSRRIFTVDIGKRYNFQVWSQLLDLPCSSVKKIEKYCGLIVVLVRSCLLYTSGLLGWIWGMARPFVVGFIIAYLLWRPLRLLEKPVIWLNERTGGHLKDKTVRTIGITVLFVLVGVLVAALGRIVAPQLATSISTLSSRLPGYLSSMETTLNGWISALGMGEDIYQLLARGLDWPRCV